MNKKGVAFSDITIYIIIGVILLVVVGGGIWYVRTYVSGAVEKVAPKDLDILVQGCSNVKQPLGESAYCVDFVPMNSAKTIYANCEYPEAKPLIERALAEAGVNPPVCDSKAAERACKKLIDEGILKPGDKPVKMNAYSCDASAPPVV